MPRIAINSARRAVAVVGACALVIAVAGVAIVGVRAARAAHVGTQHTYTVREYVLPHQGAYPHDPAVGPDGMVWFADQQSSYIGRLDPETGDVKEFETPTPASGPHGIIVASDGMVWYTGN